MVLLRLGNDTGVRVWVRSQGFFVFVIIIIMHNEFISCTDVYYVRYNTLEDMHMHRKCCGNVLLCAVLWLPHEFNVNLKGCHAFGENRRCKDN